MQCHTIWTTYSGQQRGYDGEEPKVDGLRSKWIDNLIIHLANRQVFQNWDKLERPNARVKFQIRCKSLCFHAAFIDRNEGERESETVSMIIKTKPNQSRLHQKHQKVFLMLSLVMKLSNLNILHVLYIISFLTSIQCTMVASVFTLV